jgi:hypothetical protein
MTPARVVKRGGRRYTYYTCTGAQKRGWDSCPSKSVPAAALERFVLQQLLEADAAAVRSSFTGTDDETAPSEHASAIDSDRLSAAQRFRLVRSRLQRVEYDGAVGKVAITLRHGEETAERREDGENQEQGMQP